MLLWPATKKDMAHYCCWWGGNGDSGRFSSLLAQLANRYTAVRYDRRANAHSSRDTQARLNMAQQGRDAAAVIRAAGNEPAYVFGNSAGANIALKLTRDSPELVRGLVDHEPPVTDFLPDVAWPLCTVKSKVKPGLCCHAIAS